MLFTYMFTNINGTIIIIVPIPLLVWGVGTICSTVCSVNLGRSIYLFLRIVSDITRNLVKCRVLS